MEDFEDDDDEMFEGITETIIPFLRIYISAGKENHDLLEVEDIIEWLSSENCSINESIKRLIDKGMLNVYACSFNKTMKVF